MQAHPRVPACAPVLVTASQPLSSAAPSPTAGRFRSRAAHSLLNGSSPLSRRTAGPGKSTALATRGLGRRKSKRVAGLSHKNPLATVLAPDLQPPKRSSRRRSETSRFLGRVARPGRLQAAQNCLQDAFRSPRKGHRGTSIDAWRCGSAFLERPAPQAAPTRSLPLGIPLAFPRPVCRPHQSQEPAFHPTGFFFFSSSPPAFGAFGFTACSC